MKTLYNLYIILITIFITYTITRINDSIKVRNTRINLELKFQKQQEFHLNQIEYLECEIEKCVVLRRNYDKWIKNKQNN